MGTTVEGVSVRAHGLRARHSALQLAVSAARETLHMTERSPEEVDLLINAGVYRDKNIGEPALAPLIQEDLGVNPGDPSSGRHGTFSFDVSNGGCGVLTAMRIADGFLRSRTVANCLVVASDANPGHGLAPGFPFDATGGALMCRWTDCERGLGSFAWNDCPDDGACFRSTVGLVGAHNVLTVEESAEFPERAGLAATTAASKVLDDNGLSGDDVDLVVASPARPAFTRVLGDGIGVPDDRIVSDGPRLHTVAFVAALELAIQTGRLCAARTVLLVCAGAGITAGAALYRP